MSSFFKADQGNKRIPLTLFLGNPLHVAALMRIEGIPPGKRTEFICRQILREEPKARISPAMQQAIYDSVSRAFQEHSFTFSRLSPPIPTERNQQPDQAGDVQANFLGFLSTLREGEDMD